MQSPVNRRGFLKTCGLAVAGSVAATASAPAGQFTGKIKKAVKYGMIAEKLSAEDKLRLIKDLGFEGVEPNTTLRSNVNAKELVKASEKVGVPVHGVVNSSHPDLKAAIDEAVMYGANSVLHVVRSDPKANYLEHYNKTQDLIRTAIGHAEKKKVHILIENVWASFLIEPLGMVRYLDELGSPWVQCYFDVGNVVRWGWPHQWLQVLGKRAVKLDIKEFDLRIAMNQGMRKGFDVPIGQGSVDWAKVREELTKIDYHGWATAEVRGGDRNRLAEVAEQMDRALDLA